MKDEHQLESRDESGAIAERISRYAELVREIVERLARMTPSPLTTLKPRSTVSSGSEVEPHHQTKNNQ
jgi:hypothetical protein